jgi:hypothetical protein
VLPEIRPLTRDDAEAADALAGLLSGSDTDDARWDALLGGRPFHIRNYF